MLPSASSATITRKATDILDLCVQSVPNSAIVCDKPGAKYDSLPLDAVHSDECRQPNTMFKARKLILTESIPKSPTVIECPLPAFSEFSHKYQERMLVNHFCNILSHLIVLREDEGNPFQRLLLPLARNSSAILNAVFALASAHLETKGVEALQNDGKSLQYHNEAICSLGKLVKKGSCTNRNEMLATIILLVYYEVVRNEFFAHCLFASLQILALTKKSFESYKITSERCHGYNASRSSSRRSDKCLLG